MNNASLSLSSLFTLTKKMSGAMPGMLSAISLFKLLATKLNINNKVKPIPNEIVMIGARDFFAAMLRLAILKLLLG
jgi:hypothetical protein